MTTETSGTALRVDREGPIAIVTLLGPGKGNAMGPAFWAELPLRFRELDGDPSCRVILLRGAGDHFSYGLDLKAMMGELGPALAGPAMAAERLELLSLIRRLQDAVEAVARCSKPVVAAVHGWCIGGGLDLIAACDLRYASSEARFSLREIKLAMVADLGSLQRLPALIGEGRARELAFTGMDIDAPRALAIGLVEAVLPSPEALFQHARKMAESIAENSPLVTRGIKAIMNAGWGEHPSAGLERVALWNSAFLQSHDLVEALGAFMERRAPRFQGK